MGFLSAFLFTFIRFQHLQKKTHMIQPQTEMQSTRQNQLKIDLKALYKQWPEIRRYLKSKGCPAPDAEDLFQEALVIFCRKKEDPDFILTVEPFHYVRNTCKLLWYNEARRRQKNPQLELSPEVKAQEDDWFQKEMKIVSIEKALATLGRQCQEILQLFYGLGWKMEEIAAKVGLRNDKVAKAQKYRCLQKAKDAVQLQPVTEPQN